MNFQKNRALLAIYVLRHRSGGGRCETGQRESSERDLDVGGDLALVGVGDGEREERWANLWAHAEVRSRVSHLLLSFICEISFI